MASAHGPDRTSVVVTGGSGFIGRAVVRALRDRGVPVTVVDRVPFPDDVDGVRVVTGDLRDAAVREEAVTPETAGIVHLAALTSVLKSVELPEDTFSDNVLVTQVRRSAPILSLGDYLGLTPATAGSALNVCVHSVDDLLAASRIYVRAHVGGEVVDGDDLAHILTSY